MAVTFEFEVCDGFNFATAFGEQIGKEQMKNVVFSSAEKEIKF